MARRRAATRVSFFAFQDIITSVVGIFVLITLIMMLELIQTASQAQSSSQAYVSQTLLDALEVLEAEAKTLELELADLRAAQASAPVRDAAAREREIARIRVQIEQIMQRLTRVEQTRAQMKRGVAQAEAAYQQLQAEDQAADSVRQKLQQLQDQIAATQQKRSALESADVVVYRDQTEDGKYLVLVQLDSGVIQISDGKERKRTQFATTDRVQELNDWLQGRAGGDRQIWLIVKPGGTDDFMATHQALDASGIAYGYDVTEDGRQYSLQWEHQP